MDEFKKALVDRFCDFIAEKRLISPTIILVATAIILYIKNITILPFSTSNFLILFLTCITAIAKTGLLAILFQGLLLLPCFFINDVIKEDHIKKTNYFVSTFCMSFCILYIILLLYANLLTSIINNFTAKFIMTAFIVHCVVFGKIYKDYKVKTTKYNCMQKLDHLGNFCLLSLTNVISSILIIAILILAIAHHPSFWEKYITQYFYSASAIFAFVMLASSFLTFQSINQKNYHLLTKSICILFLGVIILTDFLNYNFKYFYSQFNPNSNVKHLKIIKGIEQKNLDLKLHYLANKNNINSLYLGYLSIGKTSPIYDNNIEYIKISELIKSAIHHNNELFFPIAKAGFPLLLASLSQDGGSFTLNFNNKEKKQNFNNINVNNKTKNIFPNKNAKQKNILVNYDILNKFNRKDFGYIYISNKKCKSKLSKNHLLTLQPEHVNNDIVCGKSDYISFTRFDWLLKQLHTLFTRSYLTDDLKENIKNSKIPGFHYTTLGDGINPITVYYIFNKSNGYSVFSAYVEPYKVEFAIVADKETDALNINGSITKNILDIMFFDNSASS